MLGFIIPDLEKIPTAVVVILLAGVIFLACFKIEIAQIKKVSVFKLASFLGLRFIVLPLILFFLLQYFSKTLALGVCLIALLPPGTSSPAFSHVYRGNTALAFALLLTGSLLAPFSIPFVISLVVGHHLTISTSSMIITLVLSIILPMLIFLFLKNMKPLRVWADREGPVISIVLIGMTLTIAVAKRKDIILHSPHVLLLFIIVSSIAIGLFYLVGWCFYKKANLPEKTTYSLCSGANNLSLGITIALLYFPPEVALFLVAAEIPWILAFIPFKRWIKKRTGRSPWINEN